MTTRLIALRSAKKRGGMGKMLLNRTLFGLLSLLVISIVVFLATQALPGDAAQAILGREATPERLEALRKELGLGGPLWAQYLSWLQNILTLNLGDSLANGKPVVDIIGSKLVNSTVLMALASVVAIPLSIFLGTMSALKKDKATDHVTSIVTLVLASLPEFVVGVFLILFLSTGVFHLFPAVFIQKGDESIWSHPEQLVLPVLTLVLAVSPYITRIMRATMLEVLDSQYVQQARLKGLAERTVILRHSVPNSIGPVAQVIALQLAWMIGGVVIIEYLFRFPGIGFLLIDSVSNRDLPIIQALVLIIALFYVVVNLLADTVTLAANPKVRTAQ